MNKKLLLNPEVAQIAKEYLKFFSTETGISINYEDAPFSDFIVAQLGEIKQKSKNDAERIVQLAEHMQAKVPSIKVFPSGKNLRSNTNNIVNKLKTFLKTWKNYSDEVILEATKLYGEEVQANPNRMFSPLNYFILKDGQSKLSEYCDKVLEGEHEVENNHYKSNII